MSGMPNPNQIAELLQCAQLVRQQDNEADRLRELIQDSQKRLDSTQSSRNRNVNRAVKLLEMMDCTPGGNFGSEARMVWLLSELADQAAKKTEITA